MYSCDWTKTECDLTTPNNILSNFEMLINGNCEPGSLHILVAFDVGRTHS